MPLNQRADANLSISFCENFIRRPSKEIYIHYADSSSLSIARDAERPSVASSVSGGTGTGGAHRSLNKEPLRCYDYSIPISYVKDVADVYVLPLSQSFGERLIESCSIA